MAWVPSTLWWRPHETWDGTNFNKRPSYPPTRPILSLHTSGYKSPHTPFTTTKWPCCSKKLEIAMILFHCGAETPRNRFISNSTVHREGWVGGWGKRRWSFLCDNSKKFLLNLKLYKRINSSSYILIIYMSQPNKLNLKLHFISNMLLNGLSIILKCHCIIMWAKVPFSQ